MLEAWTGSAFDFAYGEAKGFDLDEYSLQVSLKSEPALPSLIFNSEALTFQTSSELTEADVGVYTLTLTLVLKSSSDSSSSKSEQTSETEYETLLSVQESPPSTIEETTPAIEDTSTQDDDGSI